MNIYLVLAHVIDGLHLVFLIYVVFSGVTLLPFKWAEDRFSRLRPINAGLILAMGLTWIPFLGECPLTVLSAELHVLARPELALDSPERLTLTDSFTVRILRETFGLGPWEVVEFTATIIILALAAWILLARFFRKLFPVRA